MSRKKQNKVIRNQLFSSNNKIVKQEKVQIIKGDHELILIEVKNTYTG